MTNEQKRQLIDVLGKEFETHFRERGCTLDFVLRQLHACAFSWLQREHIAIPDEQALLALLVFTLTEHGARV